MNLVEKITKSQIRTDLPEFRVGDTVKVNYKIIEGKRERIQAFEGIVIAIKGSGVSKNFTVRKKSSGAFKYAKRHNLLNQYDWLNKNNEIPLF